MKIGRNNKLKKSSYAASNMRLYDSVVLAGAHKLQPGKIVDLNGTYGDTKIYEGYEVLKLGVLEAGRGAKRKHDKVLVRHAKGICATV